MKIYNKIFSKNDIIKFVTGYKKEIISDRHSRYNKMIKYIPHNVTILDYGCGWGAFSVIMRENGNRVVAIDQSANEIEICKTVWEEDDDISFHCLDIVKIEDKSFDFVSSNQVIEHTHNPGTYLHHCNRILKLNGEILISLPNIINPCFILPMLKINREKTLKQISKVMLDNYDKTHDHIQGWDPIHFTRLLSSTGFEIKHFECVEGIPLPIVSWLKFLPKKLFFKPLCNYSKTMIFVCRKVSDSNIKPND